MDKYTKVKVLGKGSFGSATLIKRKTDGALFVVKEVNIAKMSTKEQNEARNEVKILSKLSHPNIVRFVEHVEKKGILYIIMEYADGGDLHQKIKAQKNTRMKEATILHYFVQIALALDYLHNKHILHRDIKSMNVFLTSKGTVKLGDFGISTVLRNTMGMANTVCGTPYYFSPELCKNQPYNNKSDVWALGVLLYEMSALRHPFDGTSMNQLMQHIVRSPYPPLPLTFSASLRSLVASCLEKDHGKRPTVRALLNVDVVQVAMMQLGEDLAAAAEQKTRLQNIVANREEPSSSDASKQPSPTGPNPQPPPPVMPAKPVLPHHPLPITPPPRQPNDRPAELNPLVRPPLGAAANGVDPRRMPPPPPAAFVQAPHVVQHGAGALHGVPPVVPKPPVAAVPQGYVDQMRNVADFINDLKKPMHVILIEKEREAAQRRAAEDLARREAERKLREREQQIERDRRARAAAAAAKEREEQKKREAQQKDRERHLAELRRVMEEHDKRAKLQAQAKREAAAKESPRIDVPVGRGRPEAKPAAAQPHADRTPSPQVVKMGHDDVAKPAPGVKPAAFYNPQTPPAPSQPSAPRPTVAVLEDNRPAVSNAELARMAAMQERHQAVVKKAQNWVEREAEKKKAFADARRAEDERAVRDMDRHANLPRQQVPPVNLQPPAAPPQIAHGRRRSQDPSIEAAIMAPANITPPPAQLSQPLKHGVVDPDLDNWVRNDRARRDALESPVHPVGRRSEALRRSVDEADRVLRQQGVPALAPQPSVGGAFNVQFAGRNPPYIPPMRSVTPPPSPSRPIEFAARPRIQRSPQAARNEGNMGRAALSDDDRSMLAQPSKGALNPAAVQVAAPRRLLPDLGNEAAARRRSSTSDEAAAGAAAALPKPLSIWERRHGSSNDNSPNAPNKESTPESSRSTEAPSLGVETQTSEGRSRPAHLSHTRPPLGPRDKSAPPVMSPVRANASKKIAAESPGKEMVATVSYHEVPERSAVEERIRSRRAKTSSTEFPADDDNDDEDALFEAEVEEDAVIEAQRSDDGKVDAERLAEYEAMRTHIQSLIAASPRARAMLRQPTEEPVDETDEWGDEDDGPTFGDETPMSPGTENFFVPEERMFRLGHMCGDGFTGAAPVFLDGRLLLSSGGTAGTVAQAHHAKAGPTAQPGVHAEMLRSLLENAMGFECLVAAYRHLSTVEEDKTGDAASDGVDAQEHVEVARDMIEQELRRRRGVEEGQDDEVGLLDDVQQYLAFLCQLVYFDEEVNRRQ